MILYANGCSWTAGGGLEKPLGIPINSEHEESRKDHTWPVHLGKLLGTSQVINQAQGCGSNQRIIRTTFDWLSSAKYNPRDTMVVIQWTEPTRFEFYQEEEYAEDFGQIIYKHHSIPPDNDPKKWRQVKLLVNQRVYKDPDYTLEEIDFTNRYLTIYNNDISNCYRLLYNMTAMVEILKHFKIKKYFFWSESAFYTFMLPKEIEKFLSNYPLYFIRDQKDIEYMSCAHPSLKGHKQIAELLYNQITPKTNTNSSI